MRTIESVTDQYSERLLLLQRKYPDKGFIQVLAFLAAGHRPVKGTVLSNLGHDLMVLSGHGLYGGFSWEISPELEQEIEPQDYELVRQLMTDVIAFRDSILSETLDSFPIVEGTTATLSTIVSQPELYFSLQRDAENKPISLPEAERRAYVDTMQRYGNVPLDPTDTEQVRFYRRQQMIHSLDEERKGKGSVVTTSQVQQETSVFSRYAKRILHHKLLELHDTLMEHGHPGLAAYLDNFDHSSMLFISDAIGVNDVLNIPAVKKKYFEVLVLNSVFHRAAEVSSMYAFELMKLPQYQEQNPRRVNGVDEMDAYLQGVRSGAQPVDITSSRDYGIHQHAESLRWLVLLSEDGIEGKAKRGGYSYRGREPYDSSTIEFIDGPKNSIHTGIDSSRWLSDRSMFEQLKMDELIYPPFEITRTREELGHLEPIEQLIAWTAPPNGDGAPFEEYEFPPVTPDTKQLLIKTRKPVVVNHDEYSGLYYVNLYTPGYAKVQFIDIAAVEETDDGQIVEIAFDNGYRVEYAPSAGCYRLVLHPQIGSLVSTENQLFRVKKPRLQYTLAIDADESYEPDYVQKARLTDKHAVKLGILANTFHYAGYKAVARVLNSIERSVSNGESFSMELLFEWLSSACVSGYADQLPNYNGTRAWKDLPFLPPPVNGGRAVIQSSQGINLAAYVIENLFSGDNFKFAAIGSYDVNHVPANDEVTEETIPNDSYISGISTPKIIQLGHPLQYAIRPGEAKRLEFDVVPRTEEEKAQRPEDFYTRTVDIFLNRAKQLCDGRIPKTYQFPDAVKETVKFMETFKKAQTVDDYIALNTWYSELTLLWKIAEAVDLQLLTKTEFQAYRELFGGYSGLSFVVTSELNGIGNLLKPKLRNQLGNREIPTSKRHREFMQTLERIRQKKQDFLKK